MLRIAVHVEDVGWNMYMNNVWVTYEKNFESAFERALSVGFAQEKSYKNGDGQEVKWIFKEVISLDMIPDAGVDAFEVYSEFQSIPDDHKELLDRGFDPRNSEPTGTI